ncbi:response regulator transcription factor [Agrobacterium leguminum]|uniref:response regulator transcription factor n=1 Tax=Agrobacterium leguminum TaxID=2792015 RepID=UPI003CE45CCC
MSACLSEAGYVAVCASDGEEISFLGETEEFAACVLDLNLPSLDGLSILHGWRAAGRSFPILILTARGNWSERVEGIDAGADDYLPKPFAMEELLARLRAIIRRHAGHSSSLLTVGELALDTRQMRVTRNGRAVLLSPQEYRLVAYLMHYPDRVVPQQELAEQLQALHHERETNAVEVLVARVRRKLGAGSIETRRGFGYIMASGG